MALHLTKFAEHTIGFPVGRFEALWIDRTQCVLQQVY